MRTNLMLPFFFLSYILCYILFPSIANAQTSIQSVKKDSTVLSLKQKDRLFLKRAGTNKLSAFKKQFNKNWNKVFVDFTEHSLFLMGGINFAKQNIYANSYISPFVYTLDQKNVFKPGFMGGIRLDGKFKEKYLIASAFTLNRYATGVNFKEVKSLEPFIGSFSNFKAEEQILSLNITTLYRKLIPISDTARYKFYIVAGPSLDIRLSGQQLDNQVNAHYRKLFLRAQLGLEFDNKAYYTLFFHYKQGVQSITSSSIRTSLNSFDAGMLIKASDLF